jgi:hypothetical protein
MERSRGEQIARRWIRKPPKTWTTVAAMITAVTFMVLTPMGDTVLDMSFRGVMAGASYAWAIIGFERRKYAQIIGRLEEEIAELRGSAAN